jgi:hypothetical protein
MNACYVCPAIQALVVANVFGGQFRPGDVWRDNIWLPLIVQPDGTFKLELRDQWDLASLTTK